MKNALTYILFLGLLTLFFSSCGGPIESMSFKSPEGDRSIDVSGPMLERARQTARPWKIIRWLSSHHASRGKSAIRSRSALAGSSCVVSAMRVAST